MPCEAIDFAVGRLEIYVNGPSKPNVMVRRTRDQFSQQITPGIEFHADTDVQRRHAGGSRFMDKPSRQIEQIAWVKHN
jgi:hypothetical protein